MDLEEINKENIEKIIKPGDALLGLDRITSLEIVDKITRGQTIETEMANKNGFFRFFDTEENFLGILKSYDGLLKPKRLLGNFNNNEIALELRYRKDKVIKQLPDLKPILVRQKYKLHF